MANTLKFGANEWATKDGSILAYNDENNNFKPLPFTFDRESTATVVGKDGLIKTVGANEPRVDYKDNTDGAMLLEPQRRNDIAYSEDLESWSTTGTITKTNNVHISPDGTQNAGTITSNASFFDRITQTISVSTNSTYTASLFIKKEQTQTNYMGIGFIFTGGTTDVGYVIFDAINGVAVSADARIDVISEVKDFGDYWKLISTATDNGSNTSLTFNLYATLSINGTTTGNGISSPRTIWGAQLEQGSYATSLINTSGSAVTRLGDECSQTVPSGIINSSEGVLYIETKGLSDLPTSSRYIQLSKSGESVFNNSLVFQHRNNGYLRVYANGIATADIHFNINVDFTINHKIALSYKLNDYKLFIDGVNQNKFGTPNETVFSGLDTLSFDNRGSNSWEGNVKDLRLYNEALTDQELIELTKI